MAAATSSPKVGCGKAKVTASATAGCSSNTSSISRGVIFFTTAIDHLAAAAHQKKIAFVVEEPKVAGLEPVAVERGRCRRRIAVVSQCDRRAPDDHLAGLAVRQEAAALAHDRDIKTDRLAA